MAATAKFTNKNTGEVREFTMDDALKAGIPLDKFLQRLETQQEISTIESGGGANALSEINKAGASDLLTASTKSEREQQAIDIMSFGSVEEYRKQAPLKSLLSTDKDLKEKNDQASKLLSQVNTLQQTIRGDQGGGDIRTDIFGKGSVTGPIAGRKPGFTKSKEAIDVQTQIGELFSERAKALSGVAINPEELKRMKTFLPHATDQEREVGVKLDRLDRSITMNMKVREDALRAGKDVGKMWKEGKDDYLNHFGFGKEGKAGTKSGGFTITEIK